jgi:hypothetical protein
MGQRDDAARRRFTRTALLLITDFSGNTGPGPCLPVAPILSMIGHGRKTHFSEAISTIPRSHTASTRSGTCFAGPRRTWEIPTLHLRWLARDDERGAGRHCAKSDIDICEPGFGEPGAMLTFRVGLAIAIDVEKDHVEADDKRGSHARFVQHMADNEDATAGGHCLPDMPQGGACVLRREHLDDGAQHGKVETTQLTFRRRRTAARPASP